MLQAGQFRSGDQVRARVNLPLRPEHPDFGACIRRGSVGQFVSYRKRRGDDGSLVAILFVNPTHRASSLHYLALPAQVEKA